MKSLVFIITVFSLLFAGNALAVFRTLTCTVSYENPDKKNIVDGSVESWIETDRTRIYLRPGGKVTTRMSVKNGLGEVFITVSHSILGMSKLKIRDFHDGMVKETDRMTIYEQKFGMKKIIGDRVSEFILIKNVGKVLVACERDAKKGI
jgi:hypothetical protein